MTTPEPPAPNDLSHQVSAADAAVQREAVSANQRSTVKAPANRWPVAAVAVVALAVTLWLNKDRLLGGTANPELLRSGVQQGLESVARTIEARWTATGALPASLAELGLGELPITYAATATSFRLVGVTDAGDTVIVNSAARPAPEARP